MKTYSYITSISFGVVATFAATLLLGGLPSAAAAGCCVSECNASGQKKTCCRQQLRCEEWWVQPCPIVPPAGQKIDYEFKGNQQLLTCDDPFEKCQ
jgi:hypothetical protein